MFSGSILYYTATRRDASHLKDYLDSAINFYSRGFSFIKETFNSTNISSTSNSTDQLFDMKRMLVEITTTILSGVRCGFYFSKNST